MVEGGTTTTRNKHKDDEHDNDDDTQTKRSGEAAQKAAFPCTQDAETGAPEKFSVHGIPSRAANSREPASQEEHQRGYTSNAAAAGFKVKVQGLGL